MNGALSLACNLMLEEAEDARKPTASAESFPNPTESFVTPPAQLASHLADLHDCDVSVYALRESCA